MTGYLQFLPIFAFDSCARLELERWFKQLACVLESNGDFFAPKHGSIDNRLYCLTKPWGRWEYFVSWYIVIDLAKVSTAGINILQIIHEHKFTFLQKSGKVKRDFKNQKVTRHQLCLINNTAKSMLPMLD